ncbi:translocation/assembly module TamB domain-containing protein [Flavobacterium sp.]|uniref:translocation/assembly module TamB domain-containing protein n=1 Tax=Flavobacterium sp. TaxID=239 RepID=UPI0026204171|nr:translocation/assembly module TamB domain-containing protein [Flavobacterium sp.]MDD3005115.1 translocation/assembly module TamB domain-containing protein [Flavobacterium sp.]
MKRYFYKILRVLGWIIGILIVLILIVFIAIQIPFVQNFAKDQAVAYLENKINSKVVVENFEMGFPKKFLLEGVYIENQQKDTLFYGKKIALNLNTFALLNNKLEINDIQLDGIVGQISRDKKGIFNFDYIINSFATDEPKKEDANALEISLNKIKLHKIRVKYDDEITQNFASVNLNYFETVVENFDLKNLDFDVPKITVDGFKGQLKQGIIEEIAQETEEIVKEQAQTNVLKINVKEIALTRINLDYNSESGHLKTTTDLEQLTILFDKIDLKNQFIDIKKIQLIKTKSTLALTQKTTSKKQQTTETSTSQNNWKLNLSEVEIDSVDFKFDDFNSKPLTRGIDYKHLDLNNLKLEANSIVYSSEVISGSINSLKIKDKSGVQVDSLTTDFSYAEKGAFLKKLYLKTPQTRLQNQIIIGYKSIDDLSKNIGDLALETDLRGSQIGFKDILLFAPELAQDNPFKSNPNAILKINSQISGLVKDFKIPNLELSGIGITKIVASGRVTGLPDIEKTYFDLNFNRIQSSAKDLNRILPKGTLPNNIQLPNHFAVKGKFKGGMNHFKTDLNLQSSSGNAKINAAFDRRRKNAERYNAIVSVDRFDLGRLLKNDSIGVISVNAKVNGVGLNPKTANATVSGTVKQAQFNGYNYNNLILDGSIANGLFDAKASMNDPNLTFKLATSGGFKDQYPAVKVKMNVDIADLEKLNLHAGPLKIRGNMVADFPTVDLDYLNGKIDFSNINFANDREQIALDSIKIHALATTEKNRITLQSQFANAELDGKFKLTEIAQAIQNSIAKYFDTNPKAKNPQTSPQNVAFKINIKDDPTLQKIIPNLTSIQPIEIVGKYNSVNDTIEIKGKIPKIIYNGNTITGAVINVNKQDESLIYNVVVDDISNASVGLPYTKISGSVANNVLDYNLLLKDSKNKDRYAISGNLEAKDNAHIIKLNADNFLLNYEKWGIPSENSIIISEKGLMIDNFNLSKDGSSIKIQSQQNAANAPLEVNFVNFDLTTLTNIIKKENLEATGTLNGNVLLKDLKNNPLFTADLNIANFTFNKDTVGTINIKVDNKIAKIYDAKVAITGNDNQVDLSGTYKADSNFFDFILDLQKLNMKSIQGFTMGNLTQSEGFLSGKFSVKGTLDNPNVNGDLNFNDVGFNVKQLNSTFKNINDKIVFNQKGILFDDFQISDENNNKLFVKGTVLTQNFQDFGFNLNIDADNFRAVNSGPQDNELYYGKLFLDTRIAVKGDLDKPIVDGTLKINKDTEFTIVLPQSDPSIADREGIVEFIDQDNPPMITKLTVRDTLSQTKVKGIEAFFNIEIVKEATISIIIDKGNGDFLKLKGEAQLNGGIDASGKTTLTGRYEFTEGSYEMTFNLIKRKFDIKKGSYILWTGEPTDANVNITAVYKTEASPIDLVEDQLSGKTASIRNTYKQKIPFETELIMKGELLKPEITFDVVLPDGNNNVSTEIINLTKNKLAQLRQQPSELNKQVFALLLLNRFIGENPFSSEAGTSDASSIARQSVSKILSQQLNNLASDLIDGIELDFNLESTDDYTTGEKTNKTDLNVGVSKRLLDDRLKVTVGSSFGIEGPQQANEDSNRIAGDVSLDYQLSKDGRYRVRAYRKNDYQVALQGQVVETGVAFIITFDYDKFRELFHRSKEEKEAREKAKQLKKREKQKNQEKNDSKKNNSEE